MAETITIAGERLFPESITADAAGNIYVGSNPGTIFRAERGSAVARPWIVPDAANGLQSVFGVLADDRRGLLWVCSNPNTLSRPPQQGVTAIKAFALADGHLLATYPFPAGGPAMCNDMTIAANGDIYASDMLGARIVRLRANGTAFEPWAASEHFAGLDGISFGPGGALYANNIQRNLLLRIPAGSDGLAGEVEVVPTSHPLDGPDGLRRLDADRMLQSEGNAGTITILTFADDGCADVEVIASGVDYASSVTHFRGRAYFPEGKLSYLFDPSKAGQHPGTFTIRSVAIPEAD